MDNFDFVICGSNTGAMMAAAELGKKNKVAIINPAPNWGAHFAGIMINGLNFDIGMNFFEFTTFHKHSTDLMTYDPAVRNDSARFVDMIKQVVTSRIPCHEVTAIECLVDGVYGGDIVMANSLEILKKLPDSTRNQIKSELEEIIKKGDRRLHASQKKLNEPLFMSVSYDEVSKANHGETFHKLVVEPMCHKIFNMSSKDCPSLLHRIAWAPLFYPETLLKGLEGKDEMAPTLFHYPTEAYFAAITDHFAGEIKSNPNITVFSSKVLELKKDDLYEVKLEQANIRAKHAVWTNDLLSLLQAARVEVPAFTPQKASVTVAFCLTDATNIKRQFSCLYICDSSTELYRITNQEYSAGKTASDKIRLVLEANYDVLFAAGIDSDEKILEYMNKFLVSNGILHKPLQASEIVIKSLKNAVNLPTLGNYNNFEKLFNLTREKFPDIELMGPASGFVSTSYNDNIVQGLKIGKKYN